MSRAEELAHRALDESLTPEELKAFNLLLQRQDREAIEALEILLMDGMMAGICSGIDVSEGVIVQLKQDHSDQLSTQVVETIRSRQHKKKKLTRWTPVLALAVTLIVALGMVFVLMFRTPPPMGMISHAVGGVAMERAGRRLEGQNGTFIRSGDRLQVLSADSTLILLNDGSRLTLRKGCELVLNASDSETLLELESGGMMADLRPQSKPFDIQTPALTVSVVGTVFSVTHGAEKGLSTVKVEKGKVKLKTAGSDLVQALTAGETYSVSRERVIYFQRNWDFETAAPSELKAQGERTACAEVPAGNRSMYCLQTNIDPQASRKKVYAWGPVFENQEKGLFTTGDDWVLRFKYYVPSECKWLGVHLRSIDMDDNYYIDLKDITYNSWQDVALPLRSFISNTHDLPLAADILIHRLQIQTSAERKSQFYVDDIRIEKVMQD